MTVHQIFLSVVVLVRNESTRLPTLLGDISGLVSGLATDYEVIIVDNASDDNSADELRTLTGQNGLPNLQVFVLAKQVDADTAIWAGAENALGDFVAVLDPAYDDISQLPCMLDRAMQGADVVFAENLHKPRQGLAYRVSSAFFYAVYRWLSGVDLGHEAQRYRIMSRRVINYVLKHPSPAMAYRYLPVSGGFPRASLRYEARPAMPAQKRLGESVDRAMRLMVSTTRAPMRIVTSLSLFGALANLVYSGYVIAVAILKTNVEPGWVTLSLQQSGMFFMLSLVLWILGEYVLQMASLSNEGPRYHVAQELTSAVMTRRTRLNVDDAAHPRKEEVAYFSAPRNDPGRERRGG